MKIALSMKSLMLAAAIVLLSGCAATVPLASKEQDAASKSFRISASGKAAVYVYRENVNFGKALTKVVYIDGVALGATAPGTFFHREVAPGEHTIATQAEFGENTLKLNAEAGKSYYFQQYMKWGTFKGSAGIEAVSEEVGKKGVLLCNEAK